MDYLNTIEYRISPVRALKIARNCSGCGRKTFFVSTGQFRINANGSLVDIWLVYQCEKIDPKTLGAESAKVSVGSALSAETDNGCVRIIIQNPYRMKVRIDKLLPELTKISRSQMKKLIQEEKICFAGTYLAERTEIILRFPFSPLPF